MKSETRPCRELQDPKKETEKVEDIWEVGNEGSAQCFNVTVMLLKDCQNLGRESVSSQTIWGE
jgi:hypothetical protein